MADAGENAPHHAASEADDTAQVPAGFPSRAAAAPAGGASAPGPSGAALTPAQTKDIGDLLRSLAVQEQIGLARRDKHTPKPADAHRFWGTQPVPQHADTIDADGPIEPDKADDEIRKAPLPLPKEYEWCLVDVTDEDELRELYTLLTENYVEDDDAMFRFDYSASFLKWGLQPPGWKKDWHLAVRVKEGKRKLVAFISAIPSTIRVREHQKPMVEINFLCVHKKLRSKRLAPVLIKEITRRVHLTGVFQAVYTAGVLLPKPVSSCRYYHRSINPKKLVETGFSHLGKNMTVQRLQRIYKLPDNRTIPGFRRMEAKDVDGVHKLLGEYLLRYEVAPIFSLEEIRHWFLPIEGVIESFVTEDPESHQITDFVSFYSLPSSVINNDKHRRIEAAYLFYYACESYMKEENATTRARLQDVVRNGMAEARDRNYDVFNCLELMDNPVFLDELKFGRGDGTLHYYLYNFRARPVDGGKMGLVLL